LINHHGDLGIIITFALDYRELIMLIRIYGMCVLNPHDIDVDHTFVDEGVNFKNIYGVHFFVHTSCRAGSVFDPVII